MSPGPNVKSAWRSHYAGGEIWLNRTGLHPVYNTLHLRGIRFSAAADFWLTSCSSRYVVHHSLWWSVCQPARPESQTYTWWPGATRYLCGLCWRWSQTGRPQTSVTYPKWRKSGCTLKKKCKEYFNSNCSCNINCFNNFERLLQTNKLTKLLLT